MLLSDINFTSMVPELSRSADHLCQGEEQQNTENNNNSNTNVATGSVEGGPNTYYYKGSHLKTPDYTNRGYVPIAIKIIKKRKGQTNNNLTGPYV